MPFGPLSGSINLPPIESRNGPELFPPQSAMVGGVQNSQMTGPYTGEMIDDYLRKRLMPVEGAIPRIPGIEMYGNSVPAGTVATPESQA